MTSLLARLRRLSLRLRITLAFVLTAAGLTVALSLVTFHTVRSFLEDQRVTSSTRQTVLGLLFARQFLRSEPERAEELVSLLQTRERFDAMVTSGQEWFSTALSLTPDAVPPELRSLVQQERLAYQLVEREGSRALAFGGPLPPERTDLYLFYSLADIDRTLSILARVLALASIGIVAIAAISAQRISRRVLQPLTAVSAAAQRVAEGLLETRVRAASADEVGLLAASFNQMAEALQEMIERERRFVASVSHELRTPLAALHTTGELLAAHRDELPPAGREAVDLVVEDIANLRHLVEELMEVSELDLGRPSVRWEEVDLRQLAAAVLRQRRRRARLEGPPVTTYTDKARVERILGNLVDNAYQHGEGRGVAVSLREGDTACELTVSDRGPGIEPGALPHLFDRFYKADRSRSRDRGGIGLGLTIAFENARLLGGTIEAAPVPGGGAAFTLRLPRRTEPVPEEP